MSTSSRRALALDNETVVLVLQGGGALGAYQGGVIETLAAMDVDVRWVAGVSIGAINAAIVAGNPPERRLERLRAFWDLVSSGPAMAAPFVEGQRGVFNQWSATVAATFGVPGFYRPRVPPAVFQPAGTPGALALYDNSELRATLERLVDFDLVNAKTTRLSVGAVDVATGNSAWFDNHAMRLGPEHILASCALPPAFAPVEIDGASYWDGGVLSNTPLQYVLDARGLDADAPLLIVQVDLFPARGPVPVDLAGVLQRYKDIQYSSRSRFSTDKVAETQRLRGAMRRLIHRLPASLRDDPSVRALDAAMHVPRVDIVHLIYRQSADESASKDFEFSRPSMREHWAAGVADMRTTNANLDQLQRTNLDADVTVYDLAQGVDAAPKPDTATPTRARRETAAVSRAERALDQPPGRAKPRRRRST